MAEAIVLEWVLPGAATGVVTAVAGPVGSTEVAVDAALAAIRAGVDEDFDDLAKVAGAIEALDGLRGAPGGVATLDAGGLVPAGQLPAIAISETFVVGSQAAMLALAAQQGDVAIRTDVSRSYVLASDSPGVLADWKELITPTAPVQSVNGYTGSVNLSYADVGAQPADADLTQLGQISHAAGDLIQDVGGTWTNRSLSQVLAGGATLGGGLAFSPDNTLDVGASGLNRPRDINLGQDLGVGRNANVTGSIRAGGAASIYWLLRSVLLSPADGQLRLTNNAGNNHITATLGTTGADTTLGFSGGLTAAGLAVGTGASPTFNQIAVWNGGVQKQSLVYSQGLNLASDTGVNWSSTSSSQGARDVFLVRSGPGLLSMQDGANPQGLLLHELYTGPADYRRAMVRWTGGDLYIGGEAAGAGVSAFQVHFKAGAGGAMRWYLGASQSLGLTGGAFFAGSNNTLDLGITGTGAFKTGYFGTSVIAPLFSGGSGFGSLSMNGNAFNADIGGNTNNATAYVLANRNCNTSNGTAVDWLQSKVTFNPSSGASDFRQFRRELTINQTGAASGGITADSLNIIPTAVLGPSVHFARWALNGVDRFQVTSLGRVTADDGLVATAKTFATLPASPADGVRCFIADSSQPAAGNFAAAAAGGGSNHVPVYYDGGAGVWRIG